MIIKTIKLSKILFVVAILFLYIYISALGVMLNSPKTKAAPGDPTSTFPQSLSDDNDPRTFMKVSFDNTGNEGNGFIDTPITYASLYFPRGTTTFQISISHGGINGETDRPDDGHNINEAANQSPQKPIINYEFYSSGCLIKKFNNSTLKKNDWEDLSFGTGGCSLEVNNDYPLNNQVVVQFKAIYTCKANGTSCNGSSRDFVRSKGFKLRALNAGAKIGLTGVVSQEYSTPSGTDCTDIYNGTDQKDLEPNQCPTTIGHKTQNNNEDIAKPDPGGGSANNNYTIKFAPPCSISDSGIQKKITWYDADRAEQGGAPDDKGIDLSLQEQNQDGTPTNRGNGNGFIMTTDGNGQINFPGNEASMETGAQNVGGTRAFRKVKFILYKDKQYVWQWKDVYKPNQLQFSIPYPAINSELDCSIPTCGSITPTAVELNTAPPITVNYIGGTSQTYGGDLTITNPGGGNFLTWSGNYSNSAHTEINKIFTIPGIYNATWHVNYETGTIECTGTIEAGYKPYLKFYGNDVQAGGAFGQSAGTGCSVAYKDDANINTYNKGSTGGYAGASNQYGASALDNIQEFSSAQSPSTPNPPFLFAGLPGIPKSLTFANHAGSTGGGGGTEYGGDSDIWRCIPDFYSLATPTGSSFSPGTINGRNTIKIPENTDVFINGSVFYANSGSGWASIPSIPSYSLIVKGGNIYIGNGVTNLDGVYIAQPKADGTKGEIFTCAPGVSSTFTNAQLYGSCGTKLTINGAFIAKKVWFLRTNGTLNLATTNETQTSTNIAEVFNFTPEIYLTAPTVQTQSYGTYDYIVTLPPIL